jgi:ferritin-like metal-binding protein YciE
MISESSSSDIYRITSVNSNYLLKLHNTYFAENYCYRHLPALVKRIPKNELRTLLDNHLYVITLRKIRLEKILLDIDEKANGIVCVTFKKLIGKAASIIYHRNEKDHNNIAELISALLEISIYRSYLYNSLLQLSLGLDKPSVNSAFLECLREEDEFFHTLLRVKQNVTGSDFSMDATFQSA